MTFEQTERNTTLTLRSPYLILLGDVPNIVFAKTANGLAHWAKQSCLGQLSFPGCNVDTGLPDINISDAASAGAKSLVIGCAPVGGAIQDNWMATLLAAIEAGMDIVSGLHTRLIDNPVLSKAANRHNVRLIDVRVPPSNIPVANGEKRVGKRLLTVGTDCAVGKKYTALTLTQALKRRDIDCDFRATGQTGIMIAGGGIPIDAVVSDFLAGAAEQLSPDNHPDHWDIIEGQGSLFNPAYAGVSLGLLHGSQPDALVICHDATRKHIIGAKGYPMPDIEACISLNLHMASLTNPNARSIGVCVNSSSLQDTERMEYLQTLSEKTQLPCVDPIIDGVETIIDSLLK